MWVFINKCSMPQYFFFLFTLSLLLFVQLKMVFRNITFALLLVQVERPNAIQVYSYDTYFVIPNNFALSTMNLCLNHHVSETISNSFMCPLSFSLISCWYSKATLNELRVVSLLRILSPGNNFSISTLF